MFYRYKNKFLHDKCHKNFIHYLKCYAWMLLPVILTFSSPVATYIERNFKHQVIGSFYYQMIENHAFAFIFGITGMIVAGMILMWSRSELAEQIFPECGYVDHTHQEIDDQVNSPAAEFYPALGIFTTPELVVGFHKGVKAVCYDEIVTFRVVEVLLNVKNDKNKWEQRKGTNILFRLQKDGYIYLAETIEPYEKVYEEITKLQAKCSKYNPNLKEPELAGTTYLKLSGVKIEIRG